MTEASGPADSATVELPTDGPAAPPRLNGELVFEAPWQARAFGVAVALAADGAFAWSTFQDALIAEIEADGGAPGETRYWTCWLDALSTVSIETGLSSSSQLEERSHALAHRPAGHDH